MLLELYRFKMNLFFDHFYWIYQTNEKKNITKEKK